MISHLSLIRRQCGKLILAAALLSAVAVAVPAQKVDKEKLDTGTRRAAKAAKVLRDLAALAPAESIPKDLLAKARVVAVFPDITKINVLFEKAMKGYGLVSRRIDGGWSMPAYYGFGVQDKGWTRIKSESPGVIMLFIDDTALKAFEKDHIAIEGAHAGPISVTVSEVDTKKIVNERILVYALADGVLKGVDIASDDSAMS
jgi:lipid-binding SYLF domain-containing protein